MADIKKFEKRAVKAEAEVKRLMEEIEAIMRNKRKGQDYDENDKHCAEYEAAAQKNARLRYQLKHINSAIKKEGGKPISDDVTVKAAAAAGPIGEPLAAVNIELDDKHSLNFKSILEDIFGRTIEHVFKVKSEPLISVCTAKNAQFGDYQCNAAMSLPKKLKGQPNAPANPRAAAQLIIDNLPQSNIIQSTSIAGPGFINITLNFEFMKTYVLSILKQGLKPPKVEKKRVIIDFSSPNIAKEMHVGHLRSTIIGDFFSRLLEYVGHDVQRINHLGDWGTQFGMLIAYLKEKFPNYATVSPPIHDLQSFYAESKKRYDEDPVFNKVAHDEVVKLQSGKDEDVTKAWKLICDVSLEALNQIYERLDTHLTPKGESFYQSRMDAIINELMASGKMEVDDQGRKILWRKGGNIPLIMAKSDGGFTYDTSDMATLRYRLEEEKADWLVYVVGSSQAEHLQNVFVAGKELGWVSDKTRIDHVDFGNVLGEDGKKFSSRDGNTIKLRSLLDEGVEKAHERIKESSSSLEPELVPHTAEALAYGCIKYVDLSHNRTGDYSFSYDKMLADKGNTACYLMYAYARIKSILRKPEAQEVDLKKALEGDVVFEHPKERKLIFQILQYAEMLERVMADMMPHYLCDYVYELCTVFTEFYDNCRCLNKDKETGKIVADKNRLLLCEATAITIRSCFDILGFRKVEKM